MVRESRSIADVLRSEADDEQWQ
ncbi:hypothetical protein HALO156_130432 [Halomonas sp. 156]|nr:hypothetical protein HALO156_130432 [Halomonas sp. 156]